MNLSEERCRRGKAEVKAMGMKIEPRPPGSYTRNFASSEKETVSSDEKADFVWLWTDRI